MSKVILPDTLYGNWICAKPNTIHTRESNIFLRRDFNLSEIPALAEIWITCHSHFNHYINEQHISFGPSPSIASKSYVQFLNITYLLQIGKNAICIQAYNADISRFGNTGRWTLAPNKQQPPALMSPTVFL